MKRKIVLLLYAIVAFSLPVLAHAETINQFNSTISIARDSSIEVTESIVYDFGTTPHHGIFRDIPYHYSARGGSYNLRIKVNSVTDDLGNADIYSVSSSNGQLHIKIGDPNITVTGIHTYVISYTVQRALNYFSDHDELYWNVTGNGWVAPMAQAQATVKLPENVAKEKLQADCFAGNVGATVKCSLTNASDGQVVFSQQNLPEYGGLTIVVGFPTGLVAKPGAWQNFKYILSDNWVLALPLATLLVMLWLWYKKGRDPLGFSTIVPQYEPPPGLTPTEVGTIVDETADNQDVSAEIVHLAVLGYIKITKVSDKILFFEHTDYQLELLKPAQDLPNLFQRTLVEGIFNGLTKVSLSQLGNKFYIDLQDIKDEVYDSVVVKGYFLKDPRKVRRAYVAVGVVLLASCFLAFKFGGYAAAAVAASGIIVLLFSKFMPRHTAKGAQAKQYILGLKMYLSVAEKDRLKFFNAPEKSPERFEKLLPYAMVLGVEKQWAKQFEGIYNRPPAWYADPAGGSFNSLFLVSSLRNFSASANTTFASRPQGGTFASGGGSGFGGGGFSGGGFGGGGGGSW